MTAATMKEDKWRSGLAFNGAEQNLASTALWNSQREIDICAADNIESVVRL